MTEVGFRIINKISRGISLLDNMSTFYRVLKISVNEAPEDAAWTAIPNHIILRNFGSRSDA
jgi:hypothetical protein